MDSVDLELADLAELYQAALVASVDQVVVAVAVAVVVVVVVVVVVKLGWAAQKQPAVSSGWVVVGMVVDYLVAFPT